MTGLDDVSVEAVWVPHSRAARRMYVQTDKPASLARAAMSPFWSGETRIAMRVVRVAMRTPAAFSPCRASLPSSRAALVGPRARRPR